MPKFNNELLPLPVRARLARKLIQFYNFGRGKDRLFLILRGLLNIPRSGVVEIAADIRLQLNLDDYLQRWIFCHRLEDEHDYYLMSRILKKGEHFIDVGANIGIVSLLAAKAVGPDGVVYAIEALSATREFLERNLELNTCSNVRILPFALMDETREVEFYASIDGNIGGSSLSGHGPKDSPVTVQGRTLDSLVADGTIGRCDVMKMDIEGAEPLAIKGMTGLLATQKPRVVMIEVADVLLAQFGATAADILKVFSDLGYDWFRAGRGGRLKRITESDLTGFDNLWAVLPGGVDKRFLSDE